MATDATKTHYDKTPARNAAIEKAWRTSQRARTTRTLLRRMAEAPPLTAEQKLSLMDAAHRLPILDQQRASQ